MNMELDAFLWLNLSREGLAPVMPLSIAFYKAFSTSGSSFWAAGSMEAYWSLSSSWALAE
jgi:hypothetical protein